MTALSDVLASIQSGHGSSSGSGGIDPAQYRPHSSSLLQSELNKLAQQGSASQFARGKSIAAGGGGSLVGKLLHGALWAVGAPQRTVLSADEMLFDIARGKFNAHPYLKQVMDPSFGSGRIVQEVMPHANPWLKRALGLAGDIVTDPLTYVAPGLGEGFAEGGKQGVARVAYDAAEKAGIAGDHATETEIKNITAKMLRSSSVRGGGATREEMARLAEHIGIDPAKLAYGVKLHIPFTQIHAMLPGTEFIGRGVMGSGEAVSRFARESWVGKLSGYATKAITAVKSGDPEAAYKAVRYLEGAARGEAAGSEFVRAAEKQLNEFTDEFRKQGIDHKAMYDIMDERPVPNVGALDAAQIPEAQRLGGPRFQSFVTDPKNADLADRFGKFLDSIRPFANTQGSFGSSEVKAIIGDSATRLRSFTPRIETPEFMAENAKSFDTGKAGLAAKAKAGTEGEQFLQNFTEGPYGKYLQDGKLHMPGAEMSTGETAGSYADQIENAVRAKVQAEGGQFYPWYERDIVKATRAYIHRVGNQVRNTHTLNFLVDKGIADTLDVAKAAEPWVAQDVTKAAAGATWDQRTAVEAVNPNGVAPHDSIGSLDRMVIHPGGDLPAPADWYIPGMDAPATKAAAEEVAGGYWHGSSGPLTQFVRGGGGEGNLLGPGVYVTDQPSVARTYGRLNLDAGVDMADVLNQTGNVTENPNVLHRVEWQGANAPNVLDAEVPQHAVSTAAKKALVDAGIPTAGAMPPELRQMWSVVNDATATATQVYEAIGQQGFGHEVTTAMNEQLRQAGVDALRYQGGARVGGEGAHEATVFLDPEAVKPISSSSNLTRMDIPPAPGTAKAPGFNRAQAVQDLKSYIKEQRTKLSAQGKVIPKETYKRYKDYMDVADRAVKEVDGQFMARGGDGYRAFSRAQNLERKADQLVRDGLAETAPAVVEKRAQAQAFRKAYDLFETRALLTDPADAQVAHLAASYHTLMGELGTHNGMQALTAAQKGEALSKVLAQAPEGLGMAHQLPADVASYVAEMQGSYNVLAQNGATKFVTEWYDPVNHWMKSWLTMAPGFSERNLMGGMFNNMLAGVKLRNMWKWLTTYQKGAKAFDELEPAEKLLYTLNQRAGIVGSGQFIGELGTIEDVSFFNPGAGIHGGNKTFIAPYLNRRLNEQVIEPVLRGSLFTDRVVKAIEQGRFAENGLTKELGMKGVTEENWRALADVIHQSPQFANGMADVAKYHFNYNDLSRFERQYVRRVIPFYTWTRHNVPLQIEAFFTQPGKSLGLYLHLKNNLESGVPGEPIIPSYFGEQGFMRTPWTSNGSRVYAGVSNLPLFDPFKAADIRGQALGMISPLIKAPLEVLHQQQFNTGVPITGKYTPMPSLWKPLIPLLNSVSKMPFQPFQAAQKGKNGQWYMRDSDQYLLGQYLPFLYQVQRLFPSQPRFQKRLATTWISFAMGLNVRTNTPSDIENEIFRRADQVQAINAQNKALGFKAPPRRNTAGELIQSNTSGLAGPSLSSILNTPYGTGRSTG